MTQMGLIPAMVRTDQMVQMVQMAPMVQMDPTAATKPTVQMPAMPQTLLGHITVSRLKRLDMVLTTNSFKK